MTEGDRGAPCTKRKCALLAVLIVVFTALACLLSVNVVQSIMRQHVSYEDGPRPGRQRLTAKRYSDFVDPDLLNIQRKFYSGRLLSAGDTSQLGTDSQAATRRQQNSRSSSTANVTVFRPKSEQLRPGTCVPYRVSKDRNLTICLYEREVDQMISSYIRDFGVWEEEQVQGMLHVLAADEAERRKSSAANRDSSRVVSAMSVLDIGCNVGVYTLSAASAGHSVLAVDPVQSSLQLLAASLRLNNLTSRVTLLHNAVAHRPGLLTLHVNSGNIGGSSVSAKKPSDDKDNTVWGVCLNHLVPHMPTRRVFLKLDIEGWEERALRCAGEFFQQVDVRYVLMEWLFYRKYGGAQAIVAFMVRNGLLPYADFKHKKVLDPQLLHRWPDNVLWVKR